MNSAAKLRTRGIAALGATALVVTAFGPAAMAWDNTGAGTAANEAGVASVGLIDTNRQKDGTQGATAVRQGTNNQAMGDVRFVFPSTWKAGDTLTFKLSNGVSFSSLPTVNIDEKAYDKSTHVNVKSLPVATEGSVEAGEEKLYDGTGTPVKPDVTSALGTNGTVLTVTFNNSSSSDAKDAKYIGAINGAKINVGSGVINDISLTMDGDGATNDPKFAEEGGTEVKVTYPATVVGGTLAVDNGAVVADGTPQYVGPITVSGKLVDTNDIKVGLTGAKFATNVAVTAKAYDSTGKDLGSVSVDRQEGDITIDGADWPADAVRVVISGMAIIALPGATEVKYDLVSDGTGIGPAPGSTLGTGDSLTQTDIERTLVGRQVAVRTTSPSTNRLGGVDRYDTAARVAADALGGTPQQPKGEADTVVIASGDNYADALSAGYLTATQKASLILTSKGHLSPAAESFLRTYGAKKVFIIGGEAAVSKNVEDKLASLPAYDVQKAGSGSSSVTEEETYTATFGTPTTTNPVGTTAVPTPVSKLTQKPSAGQQIVLTVNRATPASGVTVAGTTNAVGTVSASGTVPVAPAAGNAFDAKVKYQGVDFTVQVPATAGGAEATDQTVTIPIASVSTQKTVTPDNPAADAGKNAVGDERKVVNTGANLQVIRLQGQNRFVTNRNVNEYALRNASEQVGVTSPEFGKSARRTGILVNGLTPWDALASGPLVGSYDTDGRPNANSRPKPIILTTGDALEGQAKGQLDSLSIQHAILVGGTAVLPEGLGKELGDRGVSSARLAGANRWETAKAVGDFLFKNSAGSTRNPNPGFGFAGNSPYLANGGVVNGVPDANKWADALAIGPAAAKWSRVITLTDSAKLPEATEQFYTNHSNKLEQVQPVGGTEVVSNAVVEAANKLALAN